MRGFKTFLPEGGETRTTGNAARHRCWSKSLTGRVIDIWARELINSKPTLAPNQTLIREGPCRQNIQAKLTMEGVDFWQNVQLGHFGFL